MRQTNATSKNRRPRGRKAQAGITSGYASAVRLRSGLLSVKARVSGLLLVALLGCLVGATSASAYRAPTEEELTEIRAATERSSEINHEYSPILSGVRVSSEGEWAVATIGGSIGSGLEQNAIGFYRAGPPPQWTLKAVSDELCFGPLLSNLGMPHAVALELGFSNCQATHPPFKLFVIRSVVSNQLVYRPHSIGLSGDGTFFMEHIQWHSYGSSVARATAIAYVKECTPDCANGHVDKPKAKLRFTTPVECEGRYIYARMHYVLRGLVPKGVPHSRWISIRPTNEVEGPC